MNAAGQPPTGKIRPTTTAQGRGFHAFRRWPLVPAADLLLLRHALERSTPSDGPGPANQLLLSVNEEIARRAALLPASGD
ncbi:hypothetical protein J2S98_004055 [Arthrobacter oryzae]|nr:hypothetical protein [Arthrobacter oryzae]